MDIYAEIGQRLAALRRTRKLTQEQVAERAGISGPYVARIEQGRKRPSVEVLVALADALDVPRWQLLADDTATTHELPAIGRALAKACDGLSASDLEVLRVVAEALRR